MKLLAFLMMSLCICSCLREEISLDQLNTEKNVRLPTIAIDGFISNEYTRCRIKLSEPSSIGEVLKYKPINDANVQLSDGVHTFDFTLSEEEGIYYSNDSIHGSEGIVYHLVVTHLGHSYEATSQIWPFDGEEPFPISEIVSEQGFLMFSVPIHNFGYNVPRRWNFVYGWENKEGIFMVPYVDVYDLSFLNIYTHRGSFPQGLFPTLTTTTGLSGYAPDSVELIEMAITDEYYEYILSVLNETDWSGGIFSTVPGNVETNVTNGGTGYFYGLNVKRRRVILQDLID